jgi:pectinesterase
MRRITLVASIVFSCCSISSSGEPIVVSTAGDGAFKSVQAAIDSVRDSNAQLILIKPGTYKEIIRIGAGKRFVTLKGHGDDPAKVVLTYDMNASFTPPGATQPVGTSHSASVVIEASDFTAENITFENSAGDHGQAVALKSLGDRSIFRNCRFLGWQDTLMADAGRQYYDHCYIEGRVDFIFGGATVVFDHCTIRSKNGGYVTAARTPPGRPFGYVFLDCTLSGDAAPTYLGRPWQWDRGSNAAVAFIRTKIGSHIRAEGWNQWDRPDKPNTHPESVTRYSEFGSMDLDGKPLDVSGRVKWSRQLTADEAAKYTVANVLGGDGWNPSAQSAQNHQP